MAPTTARKSKSSKESASINSKLALVVKSGRIALGYKQALKNLRNGKGESWFLVEAIRWILCDAGGLELEC